MIILHFFFHFVVVFQIVSLNITAAIYINFTIFNITKQLFVFSSQKFKHDFSLFATC